MRLRPNYRNAFSARLLVLLVAAGFLFGSLIGCTTEVQTTIWTGLNSLAVSLVNALFQALNPVSTTTPVTVSALNSVDLSFLV